MRILTAYRRVLAMLGGDKRLAIILGAANIVLAGLQFLDPVLFGRVDRIAVRRPDTMSARRAVATRAASLILRVDRRSRHVVHRRQHRSPSCMPSGWRTATG